MCTQPKDVCNCYNKEIVGNLKHAKVLSQMIPGLQGADAGGPLVRPYSPEGSWPLSPHPGTPPVGLPQAEVPLSTVDVGDAASPQAGSDLDWTLGISPQPGK